MEVGMDIPEFLADKAAMEAFKFETIKIEQAGELGPTVDLLCAQNMPGVFRHCGSKFNMPTVEHIINRLRDEKVELEIAVTPTGRADAPEGNMFAQPHQTMNSIDWLLGKLEGEPEGRHYYFQSQDDNLSELSKTTDIPREISHGSRMLGPQMAANLWIGGAGTTSRLHNDNFDNIYVQLRGRKRIYLIPPTSVADVGEKRLRLAKYNAKMELVPLEGEFDYTVFPTYNPATDSPRGWQFVVDLGPMDVLFMPALWYHQVEILGDGLNVSVNYWYKPFDDEFRWAQWNFQRQIVNAL